MSVLKDPVSGMIKPFLQTISRKCINNTHYKVAVEFGAIMIVHPLLATMTPVVGMVYIQFTTGKFKKLRNL